MSLQRQQTLLRIYTFTVYLLPYEKMNNALKGIGLSLRSICDTDKKFDARSYEYQNYLIARDYKPTLVKSLFHAIKNISRHEARKVKPKLTKSNIQLITMYNPVIKNIENILNDNLHISYGDSDIKEVFPERTVSVKYKREKYLKEIISPSLYL